MITVYLCLFFSVPASLVVCDSCLLVHMSVVFLSWLSHLASHVNSIVGTSSESFFSSVTNTDYVVFVLTRTARSSESYGGRSFLSKPQFERCVAVVLTLPGQLQYVIRLVRWSFSLGAPHQWFTVALSSLGEQNHRDCVMALLMWKTWSPILSLS